MGCCDGDVFRNTPSTDQQSKILLEGIDGARLDSFGLPEETDPQLGYWSANPQTPDFQSPDSLGTQSLWADGLAQIPQDSQFGEVSPAAESIRDIRSLRFDGSIPSRILHTSFFLPEVRMRFSPHSTRLTRIWPTLVMTLIFPVRIGKPSLPDT